MSKPKTRCSNREIRNAINRASGALHGRSWHRLSKAQSCVIARLAAERIGSCDLSYRWGKRGGTTRGNASAGLGMMALYEKSCGKKLKSLGGFDRKTVNKAKKYV